MRVIATILACALPVLAGAVTFEMPGNSVLTEEEVTRFGRYDLPTGPWQETGMPVLSGEGALRRQAWRIEAPGLSPVQLVQPLRAQAEAEGFEILFQCQTDGCGGFDFRFATDVLAAPSMHVDLGDFLFVAAIREQPETGETELLSLLVSRSAGAGHVQITWLGARENAAALAQVGQAPTRAAPDQGTDGAGQITDLVGDVADDLDSHGRAILSDLAFETGSAQLGAGEFATLAALAAYLRAHPDRRVALVGHTDSVGGLEGNIALSRRRAGSVLERLVEAHGIPRRQLDAEGMGYLAPLASNLSEDGREANRRVEVIITSTD